jgi:4-carboxymuconolactone decarboxylase
MKSGRLDWFAPEELDAEARALYDRIAGGPRAHGRQAFPLTDSAGRLNGPFNAMLVNPQVGTHLQELGSAIRYRTALSDRVREIAILEVAVLRRSAFEWYAHERVGRLAGLTDEELGALLHGADAPTFDSAERAARATVRALIATRDLDDELFAQAHAALGETALADLIALAGYYDLLSLSLAAWRTPLPAGAESPFESEREG